ncbi:MAG: hypothetical protein WCW02_02945 [Candidatus Buchananbacteria bacterium]
MKKNQLIITVVVLLVVALGVSYWLSRPQVEVKVVSEGPILYWGSGCPHCITVEEFINQNKIADKFKFERKEVFNNQANAQEMLTHAADCDTQGGGMGVPLLWDEKNSPKCLIGAEPIINYFKAKTNAQ